MLGLLTWIKAFIDKLPHWLILVLATGVGAVFSYFQAEPNEQVLSALTHWDVAWPMIQGAGVAFVGTVIALLKTAPWSLTPAAALMRKGRSVPPLAVLMLSLVVAAVVTACALFSKVAPPALPFFECVAVDAARGMSIAQIASVDPPGCGGDVPAVIAALLSSKDSKVQDTPALAEARRTGANFAADGGPR
jgi:hypothetical protein